MGYIRSGNAHRAEKLDGRISYDELRILRLCHLVR